MKRVNHAAACVLTLFLILSAALPTAAANGNVTYNGDAGTFIFQPGSDLSVTDLFPDFKDVMPGDTLTQPILVRNDTSEQTAIIIYLRALGAHEESREFLSQLTLSVSAKDSELFHAPSDQTAQLSDWVELGTVAPGGEVELTVTLQVPVTLDNRFMNAVGYLDWQFMVEAHSLVLPEQPVEPDEPDTPGTPDGPDGPDDPDSPDTPEDPDRPDEPDTPGKPDVPKTGDDVNVGLATGLFIGSGLLIAVVLWLLLKKREKKSDN